MCRRRTAHNPNRAMVTCVYVCMRLWINAMQVSSAQEKSVVTVTADGWLRQICAKIYARMSTAMRVRVCVLAAAL